jgi:hypothetical protein
MTNRIRCQGKSAGNRLKDRQATTRNLTALRCRFEYSEVLLVATVASHTGPNCPEGPILLRQGNSHTLGGLCPIIHRRGKPKSLPRAGCRERSHVEAFGDYSGYLTLSQWVSDALGYFSGTSLHDYTPYTAVGLNPKFSFRFKNYAIVNNSPGFRSDGELTIPKPPGVFRVLS